MTCSNRFFGGATETLSTSGQSTNMPTKLVQAKVSVLPTYFDLLDTTVNIGGMFWCPKTEHVSPEHVSHAHAQSRT